MRASRDGRVKAVTRQYRVAIRQRNPVSPVKPIRRRAK
jgi:hypothetical protein